jgi:hypothetical protein
MPPLENVRKNDAHENKQEMFERWVRLAKSDDRRAVLDEVLNVMRDDPYHERRAALFLRRSPQS